jgi:hypothetical protein
MLAGGALDTDTHHPATGVPCHHRPEHAGFSLPGFASPPPSARNPGSGAAYLVN